CSAIDAVRLWDEIAGSKEDIESRLGKSADVLCYPFGDYNESVIHAVRSAGYNAAVTTQRGLVEPGANPYLIKRVPIKGKTKPLSFIVKVCTDYERRKEMRRALNYPHGNGIYSPIES
ncbi:MAG: polysaccharide deacetylase family protein, partial [Nitrospirae bacterium]|nr:polysaccharide deacetylase family protein [Nitrospirota bacterium]